jgi:hypothetical protein
MLKLVLFSFLLVSRVAAALPPPPIGGGNGLRVVCVTAYNGQNFEEAGLMQEANFLRGDVISQCEQAGGAESECASRARCTTLGQ